MAASPMMTCRPCRPVSVKNVVPKRPVDGAMPPPRRRAYSRPWPARNAAPSAAVTTSQGRERRRSARAIVALDAKRNALKTAVRATSSSAFAVGRPPGRSATYTATIDRKKIDSDAMNSAMPSSGGRASRPVIVLALTGSLAAGGTCGPTADGGSAPRAAR